MASIPDQLASNFIDGAVDLSRFTASEQARVLGVLKQLELDLVKDLERVDPTGVTRTQFQKARLQQLLINTRSTIAKAYTSISKQQEGMLGDLALTASKKAIGAINTGVGIDLLSTVITPEQARSIASGVMIDGARSSEWWAKQGTDLSFAFQQQMQQGMLRGETLTELRNRIMTENGLPGVGVLNKDLRSIQDPAERDIIKTARRNAESLVRSSVQVANNDAHMATFEANQDVIQGVVWLSTLDGRTTVTCMGLDKLRWQYKDGSLIPVGHDKQFPGPTAHWGCRSTQIPWLRPWSDILGNKKMAAKLDQITPGTRASMDGQVSDKLNYQDWLSAQPVPRQIEILGPGRYEMFKAGKIDFKDLIDQTGNPLTLEQLAARIGAKSTPMPVGIDGARDGANEWATEWNTNTWKQDWLMELVNTLPDPTPGPRKSGAYFFSRGTKPGVINMGSYSKDTPDGQMTWAHEYGHHVDDQLGQLILKRDNLPGYFLEDKTGRVTSKTLVSSISASPIGRGALAHDAKILGRGSKLSASAIVEATKGYEDRVLGVLQPVLQSMEDRGVGMLDLTIRNASIEWLGRRTDDFSKLAGKLLATGQGDAKMFVQVALMDNPPAYALRAVETALKPEVRRFLDDLVGAATKNKVGFGHSDSYYRENWARQGKEAFANVITLSNLGPLGEDLVRYFVPEFGDWVLGLLRSHL